MIRCLLPSPGSLGSVPPLHRYYEALRRPAALPGSLRCPSRGRYRSCAPCSLPSGRDAPPAGLGVVHPAPGRDCRTETTGPPRFLGSPDGDVSWSSTPARPSCSATAARRCCLPRCPRPRLSRCTFRGSIPRPAPSLSTLRRVGRPTTTQDSLPAAGQRFRAGLGTRWAPTRGFNSSYLPHPGFSWRTDSSASRRPRRDSIQRHHNMRGSPNE